MIRMTLADKARIKREGTLADHVRSSAGAQNAQSLARSYALPIETVTRIIVRNGGTIG